MHFLWYGQGGRGGEEDLRRNWWREGPERPRGSDGGVNLWNIGILAVKLAGIGKLRLAGNWPGMNWQ